MLRTALAAVTALVLPRECGGCGRADTAWCDVCAGLLGAAATRPWTPTPCPPGLPPTLTVLPYAGPVRRALVAHKDGGRHDLATVLAAPLGAALATAVAAARLAAATAPTGEHLRSSAPPLPAGPASGDVWVVPVPSSRAAVRRRGERPTYRLTTAAVRLGCGTDPPPVVPALALGRRVDDQAGLGAGRRADNLAGAMVAVARFRRALEGRSCVVVDDVVTTGATLVEAARALRTAGSGPVLAVTLAASVRRRAATDAGTSQGDGDPP